MKTKLTILTLATAALMAAPAATRAQDAVPPTPPVNPPAATAETPAKRERGPGGPGAPGAPIGERIEMMKERLDLTPEQVEKIKAAFEKEREKIMALREDPTLSREQKGEKMREILKYQMEAIRPILTPEQVEKWKAGMEKRREEMEKRRTDREKK